MDEIDHLQLLLDDEALLEATDSMFNTDFPSFDIHLGETFPTSEETTSTTNDDTSSESIPCREVAITVQQLQTATADQSRFPTFSSQDIEELKSLAENKNTSRSTKQWLAVFNKWCQSRHLEINIINMAPVDLDKTLAQFYAEVKRKDGEDYEPESLKIMQSAIDRFLKEQNYALSIVRSREFNNSQQVLNAKAISLRQQGRGKRPNKSQPLSTEEESALWTNGELGDHNARVLSNTNFKNLTEQLGFRGRQEHYDAYVEDFAIRSHEDGGESVEFTENPTKTRSGGLNIKHRTTRQMMWSTDGGVRDPVNIFKLWLSKRPQGMKNNGPLYLGIIDRPKSNEVWYSKVRMGQNTIGKIMKSMAACLATDKRITNHSMRKTLVAKLKKSGHPRHIIKEITGHARESSIDDYDQMDEQQHREISHIISGFEASNSALSKSPDSSVLPPAITEIVPSRVPSQNQRSQELPSYNQSCRSIGAKRCEVMKNLPLMPYQLHQLNQVQPSQSYTNCTFNYYSNGPQEAPPAPLIRKRRRAVIFDSDDSDDEKEN